MGVVGRMILQYGRITAKGYEEIATTPSQGSCQTREQAVLSTFSVTLSHNAYSIAFLEDHFQRLEKHFRLFFAQSPPLHAAQIHKGLSAALAMCAAAGQHTTASGGVKLKCRLLWSLKELRLEISSYSPPWDVAQGISMHLQTVERPHPTLKLSAEPTTKNARNRALAHGFDEALLCDSDGIVLEGAWTNFFWRNVQGELCTAEGALLAGITRGGILSSFPCRFQRLSLDELSTHIVEGFVTQATSGITPVYRINDFTLPQCPGTQSLAIKDWYEDIRNKTQFSLRQGI